MTSIFSAKQNKAKQNKAKQNKPKQNKPKQSRASRWATILYLGYDCTQGPGTGVEVYPVQGHPTSEVWAPEPLPASAGGRCTALNGPEPAGRGQCGPRRPKITRNGPGQPAGRIRRGCDPLRYARGHWGHRTRPIGARVAPGASFFLPIGPVWGPLTGRKTGFRAELGPAGQAGHGDGGSKNDANKSAFHFFVPVPTSLISSKTE